ncbi:MAG: hypothetical protein ACLFTK_11045 [Anaerolineales bacterium]
MPRQSPEEAAVMHEAVDLIKSGDDDKKRQAVDMLIEIVSENDKIAGAWWLLANACYGILPQDSLIATENLLELNPEHEGGQRLHQRLRAAGVTPPEEG